MSETRIRREAWSEAASLAPLVPDVSAGARPLRIHVVDFERARVRGR